MAATRPAASPAKGRPGLGILWMCISAFGSSSMNGIVREASTDIHAFEIAFFRNLFGLVTLSPLVIRGGVRVTLRTKRLHLHALRGLLNAIAMLSFFYAVTVTPLATVAALSFTAPLFAALLAIPFLGERPGWRRWAGLLTGFAGALIIIRPGFADVGIGVILILLSSTVWSGALVIIKLLARTETSLAITTYAGLFLTPITGAAAFFFWSWPSAVGWLMMVAMGMFGSLTQWSIAQAFHEAEATVVLPFDFTKLLWASVIGFAFFGERPDPMTLVGGSVILGSITYVAYRERETRSS